MLVRMRCFVISGMFLLAGCSSSGAALVINIEKGDSRDPVSGQFHNAAIASALMAAQFYGMSGFATMDEGGSYYALLGTTLAHYDMGNRSLLGTWPLTRWEGDTYLPDEITTEYAIYGIIGRLRCGESGPTVWLFDQHTATLWRLYRGWQRRGCSYGG